MRNRLVFSTLATLSALALFACSGVDSDLLAPGGSSGGATDAGSTDSGRRSADGGKKSDAGSNGDTDAGGGGGGGGGGHDAGGGGGGGSVKPALCGSSLTCTTADPVCCASQPSAGLATATSYTCVGAAGECGGASQATISCRDGNDCGSSICCGELKDASGSGGYNLVACSTSCVMKDSTGTLTTKVIFCNSTKDCGDTGLTCQPSGALGGFNVCGQD